MKQISEYHRLHRPAKEVRTARFNLSNKTVSSEPPSQIFQEIHRVLLDLQARIYPGLTFERPEDYYLLVCRLRHPNSETDELVFELEICKVWLLSGLHGRFIRSIDYEGMIYDLKADLYDPLQVSKQSEYPVIHLDLKM